MSHGKCLFNVIAISLSYSAEIGPGYKIIEVFDAQEYEDYQIPTLYLHIIDRDNKFSETEKFKSELETLLFKNIETQHGHQITSTDKVDLKVYYECLCPGCKSFHLHHLDAVYKKIGSYIDLKTYPYGFTERKEENGKTVFTCQHGPEECYGNKLHACAIDILKNVSRSEFYNSCMMSSKWGGRGSTDMDATNCGQSMEIDSKPIIECANSQRGDDLLEYYGKESDKVQKRYVPWVLLNGNVFNAVTEDLMTKICEALKNPPPPCK